MRQITLESPRNLMMTEAPAPAPKPYELLVEVRATAICGTDLHIFAGHTPVTYPRVPGHEVSGVIEAVGEGVIDFSPGDAIVINPNFSCGVCELCVLGKEQLCASGGLMGREADGSLRDYLTVSQTRAFKLPGHLSFAEGAVIQPLSTVVHSQRQVAIKPMESAVVLGLGASGLMQVALSKMAGAYPVIAVGRSQWKLDLAREMEADVVVNAGRQDPVAEVVRLTAGLGADVVIEAVGIPDTINQALEMVKPGGRLLQYGISPSPLPSLDLYSLYRKEMSIIFTRAATRADFYLAAAMVASNRINLKPLITREYPLSESAAAFRFGEEERSEVLRVVIKP